VILRGLEEPAAVTTGVREAGTAAVAVNIPHLEAGDIIDARGCVGFLGGVASLPQQPAPPAIWIVHPADDSTSARKTELDETCLEAQARGRDNVRSRAWQWDYPRATLRAVSPERPGPHQL